MPLLGGIAIYLGFVLAILFSLKQIPLQQVIGILAGATLLAAVGFLDDGGLLHHQVKLFIGMPVAALFLIASGIHAQFFSEFVAGKPGAILDDFATIVWVVGITAAFSILDHMDGLCAGIAAIAAGFFTLSAALGGQMMVRTLGAATLGAALGFLRWNFNPAKIFMGDGGAMFLGFLMAVLGLKIRPEGDAIPPHLARPDSDSGCARFRHHAHFNFSRTPGLAPLYLAGKGSHGPPPLESRPRPSRRRACALLLGYPSWRCGSSRSLRVSADCIWDGGVPVLCAHSSPYLPGEFALRAPGEASKTFVISLRSSWITHRASPLAERYRWDILTIRALAI